MNFTMETSLNDLPVGTDSARRDKGKAAKLTDDLHLVPGVIVAALVAQQVTGTQLVRSFSTKHLGTLLGTVGVQALITGALFVLLKYFHDCFLV